MEKYNLIDPSQHAHHCWKDCRVEQNAVSDMWKCVLTGLTLLLALSFLKMKLLLCEIDRLKFENPDIKFTKSPHWKAFWKQVIKFCPHTLPFVYLIPYVGEVYTDKFQLVVWL